MSCKSSRSHLGPLTDGSSLVFVFLPFPLLAPSAPVINPQAPNSATGSSVRVCWSLYSDDTVESYQLSYRPVQDGSPGKEQTGAVCQEQKQAPAWALGRWRWGESAHLAPSRMSCRQVSMAGRTGKTSWGLAGENHRAQIHGVYPQPSDWGCPGDDGSLAAPCAGRMGTPLLEEAQWD